jgi:DNA replication and repair protein RecF
MKVSNFQLRSFRNLDHFKFEPTGGLNFIIGPNAKGKTTVLEGIHFLACLRSFRTTKINELIQWGQNQSNLSCELVQVPLEWNSKHEVQFLFDLETRRAKKTAFINDKRYQSTALYLKQKFNNHNTGFHTIIFNPTDHEIVRGEPKLRRDYLNFVLSSQNANYFDDLKQYHRVLDQKNALLKMSFGGPIDRKQLQTLNELLVESGSRLVLSRLEWFKSLLNYFNFVLTRIAPKQRNLDLVYRCQFLNQIQSGEYKFSFQNSNLNGEHFAGQGPLPSLEDLQGEYWKSLSILTPLEIGQRTGLAGPHRDDWCFKTNNIPLKEHGSQGEIRTALLALKISEIEFFRKVTGLKPVLLIDDFSSELDQDRRKSLLNFLNQTDLQVFITSTERPSLEGKVFEFTYGQ